MHRRVLSSARIGIRVPLRGSGRRTEPGIVSRRAARPRSPACCKSFALRRQAPPGSRGRGPRPRHLQEPRLSFVGVAMDLSLEPRLIVMFVFHD